MQPVASSLLSWYDRHARVLPWRGIHDPYRTWVSEAMLQQTRVETVLNYYDRFLAAFPTLPDLAAASEDQVLKLWEGLGYYSRARNLLSGARQVMEEYGGLLPQDPEALQKIRGIGPYTSRAIASIAFDIPVPAVDGNVIRVLSRLYGIRENPLQPPVRRRLEDLAAALVPEERPGDYNQAVMDLGAGICVPGTPDCEACPLRSFCDAFSTGDAASLPLLPAAKAPREVSWAVAVLFSPAGVLMRRRTEKLLQGLWVFPMFGGTLSGEELALLINRKMKLKTSPPLFRGTARHVFTHQVWQMSLHTAESDAAPAPAGYEWIAPADYPSLALPTAVKAASALVRSRFGI